MLYLYKNILPNANNKYYYFTTTSAYKSALASNLVETITLDNYRINTNVIKAKLNNVLTEAVADTITYAIDERDGLFRCYHVDKIVTQSGYAIFTCMVDLWASYFYKATLSNIVVNRCNRNIGTGLYDTIKGTKTYTINYIGGNTINVNNVSIVFSLCYNVKQNVLNTNSKTQLYAIDVRTLKALAQDYPNASALDIAISFVSGIVGVAATGWGMQTYNDAYVIGAWFIDNNYLVTNSSDYVSVKSVNEYMETNGVNQNVYAVIPIIQDKTINININPNYDYYVGTKHNGLKLQRTTETSANIIYRYIYGQSDLKVLVLQGENMQDITEAFSVDLTINQGNVTGIKAVAKTMGTFLNTFAGMYGIATGKPTAAVIGISNLAKTTFNDAADINDGKLINGGDGYNTFYQIVSIGLDATLHNPYAIVTCESIIDEEENARHNGAYFNVVLSNLDTLFVAALLGTGTFNDTLIMATCNIDGIPAEASNEIKNKLSMGVYLTQL